MTIQDAALVGSSLVLCGASALRLARALRLRDGGTGIAAGALFFGLLAAACNLLGAVALAGGVRAFQPGGLLLATAGMHGALAAALPRRSRPGRRRLRARLPRLPEPLRRDPWLRASVGLVALAYGLVLTRGVITPPSGTDGLFYHLPLAVHFFQTGTLGIMDASITGSYPGNFEAWTAALMWLGSRNLLSLAQLPAALILAGVVHQLALAIGSRPRDAALAGLGVAATPMVLLGSVVSYNDIFGAMLVGAALWLVCTGLAREETGAPRSLGCLAAAGLLAGAAAGSKLLLVPGAGVLCGIVALGGAARAVRSGHSPRAALVTALLAGAAFLAAAFASSGHWVVRNALAHGNPFHPVEVTILGHVLLPGTPVLDLLTDQELQWVRERWHWPFYPWLEYEKFGAGYHFQAGLGALFATFVPLGVLGLAWVVVRPRADALRRGAGAAARVVWTRRLVLIYAALLLVVWWMETDHHVRFMLTPLALLHVSVGWLLSSVGARWRRSFHALYFACLAVTLGIIGARTAAYEIPRALYLAYVDGQNDYGLPDAIDALPEGSTILNLARPTLDYPISGSRAQNRVLRFDPDIRSPEQVAASGTDFVLLGERTAPELVEGLSHRVSCRGGEEEPYRVCRLASPGEANP